MAYVKIILISINPVILEALIFSLLIIVMISMQLWIINIIHKERTFSDKKLSLSWKNKFKKLFIVNFLLVVLYITVYMILHSNFFILNFNFLIFFYLFMFLIGFSLLLYKFYDNKLKFLKILILCWSLGFITRNLNILIFSLLLNPDHFILLSLKFSVLNFILPLFIGNTILDSILRTFSFWGIRCDTVEDIINEHVKPLKDYHAMDLYLAFKKSGLLDLKLQLNYAQKAFFIGLAQVSRIEAWTLGAPEQHLLMSNWAGFNPVFDRNIVPCNHIFMNRKQDISMYKLLGRELLAPENKIDFKSTTQEDINRIVVDVLDTRGFFSVTSADKLVVLGIPRWADRSVERFQYTDTLIIYARLDFPATSSTRYDFYNITKMNNFVFFRGKNGETTEMLFRLGRDVPRDAQGLDVFLDGKKYKLDYMPFKLRKTLCGQAYRYLWGVEGFKHNPWEGDGVD